MVFTEGRFFVLFAICFAVYWAMRTQAARKYWLIVCSAIFYGAWDWRFLALMYVSVTMDYFFGRILGAERPPGGKKVWIVASLVGNLGMLAFFKYFNFFVDTGVQFARLLGFDASPRTFSILLPIGISFYTFQSMSYTIDVYRGHLKPVRSYWDFALFVTFFPQLVAGPIVRAVDFLPQLATARRFQNVALRAALTLFLVGFVKKACIADNISPVVDDLYANPDAFDVVTHWIVLLLYAVQLYCDFSGYSDMAIALAALLGYEFVLNFDFPYLAGSITDFWRRWHISLSTWFRDYLYIPLGGNRTSRPRMFFNLFTVFVLCGLWHGTNVSYAVFGTMHGTYLVIHRLWVDHVPRSNPIARAVSFAGPVLSMLAVLSTWILFRAVDIPKTIDIYGLLVGVRPAGAQSISLWWALVPPVLLAVHIAAYKGVMQKIGARTSDFQWGLAYGLMWAVALPWVQTGYTPFIYFQF